MALAIGVYKTIEQDDRWQQYQSYATEMNEAAHHLLDLQQAMNNGEDLTHFLADIHAYIDTDFSYPYLVQSHHVARIPGFFQYRITLPVHEFLELLKLLYGMPLERIPDAYDSYVAITLGKRLTLAKVKSTHVASHYFLIPFLKGLLLHTPNITSLANISFIRAENGGVYLCIANQIYTVTYATEHLLAMPHHAQSF